MHAYDFDAYWRRPDIRQARNHILNRREVRLQLRRAGVPVTRHLGA